MEDFNYFTNDFLSNGGFQQLYSTIECPEEFLWDTTVSGDDCAYYDDCGNKDSWEKQYGHEFNYAHLLQNDNTEEYAMQDSPQYYNFDMATISTASGDSLHACDSVLYNKWDDMNSTPIGSCDQYNIDFDDHLIDNDWEFNLDNFLLGDEFDSTPSPVSSLPDRTLLCNDSCNSFLKESSDNLNSNLQSFLPPTGHNMIDANCQEQTIFKRPRASNKDTRGDENRAIDEKSFICTFNNCGKVYAKAGHLKVNDSAF